MAQTCYHGIWQVDAQEASLGYISHSPGPFPYGHTHIHTHTHIYMVSVEEWWQTPIIPAFRRQRQEGCYKFKASLIYMRCCLKKEKKKRKKRKERKKKVRKKLFK